MVAPMWRLDELRCGRLSLVFVLALCGWLAFVGRPAWADGADAVPAGTAASVSGESPDEQLRRAQDLSRTTMSPFCPGRTLDACPSEYATQWRRDIRQWISEGVSTEEIRNRLKQRTDHDLTGAPSTALDSVLPVLVTVLSLGLLVVLLRVLVRPDKKVAAAGSGAEGAAKRVPDESAPGAGDAKPEPAAPADRVASRGAQTQGKGLDERLDDELRSMDD
jgi:cytochrome c-type biogenesis protein CcmH/NrfF